MDIVDILEAVEIDPLEATTSEKMAAELLANGATKWFVPTHKDLLKWADSKSGKDFVKNGVAIPDTKYIRSESFEEVKEIWRNLKNSAEYDVEMVEEGLALHRFGIIEVDPDLKWELEVLTNKIAFTLEDVEKALLRERGRLLRREVILENMTIDNFDLEQSSIYCKHAKRYIQLLTHDGKHYGGFIKDVIRKHNSFRKELDWLDKGEVKDYVKSDLIINDFWGGHSMFDVLRETVK